MVGRHGTLTPVKWTKKCGEIEVICYEDDVVEIRNESGSFGGCVVQEMLFSMEDLEDMEHLMRQMYMFFAAEDALREAGKT